MNVYQNRNSLTSSRIEIHVSHMASNLPKESLSAGELQVSGKKCCICQNSKTILHQRKREFFPSLSIKPKMRFTSGTLFQNRRLKLRRHTFFKRSCRSNVLRSRKLRLRHQRTAKSLCFDIKQALTTTMAQGFCLDRRLQQTKLVGRPIMDTQKQLFIPSRVSKETEIKSIWHSKRKLKKPFQRFRPETFSKLPTVLKYNVVKPSVNMTDLGGEVCHHIRDTGIRVRHTRSEPQKSYVTTISNDEEALMGLVLAQSLKEVKTDKKISAVVGSGVSPMLR